MELGLSLGEAPRPFSFMEKNTKTSSEGFDFCMGLGVGLNTRSEEKAAAFNEGDHSSSKRSDGEGRDHKTVSAAEPPVQLDLLPLVPVPRYPSSQLPFSWPPPDNNGNSDGSSSAPASMTRGFDVNRLPTADEIDDAAAIDSPNSIASSFQMEFSIYRGRKRDHEASVAAAANDGEAERTTSSRASDEEENGLTRKKLRLSKEQSAFLEESFKEHNTLNPKQKLALAKQLNLRPRQVEVWFQNRRARTKLKQTEVDCEYLKRCCETLTEENRKLHKELQELRALKTSHPFYMQLPATTLTMCPSCERVATTTTTTTTAAAATDGSAKSGGLPATSRPRFYPFSQQPHQSTAS